MAIGVVLPIAMLCGDRVLFGDGSGDPMLAGSILGVWKPAVYAGTTCFVLAFASWTFTGRAAAFSAGALGSGGLFASIVGVALFPLAVMGLFFAGLGLLGLTPFPMAVVYFRGASRAWREARRRPSAIAAVLLGFTLPLGAAGAAQVATMRAVERGLEWIGSGDATSRDRGVGLLRRIRFVHGPSDIASAYTSERNPERRRRLGEAFGAITGFDIESWLASSD